MPAAFTWGSNRPPTRPPLHVPPASGVPVSAVNRLTAAPSLHSVAAPLPPASGLPVSFTCTVALALVHGAAPATVYTYAPGFITAGSYIPPVIALGPLHVPPASGVPFSAVNRLAGALFEQIAKFPSMPGSACGCSLTVTVALASAQPDTPGTVYTNTPGACDTGS